MHIFFVLIHFRVYLFVFLDSDGKLYCSTRSALFFSLNLNKVCSKFESILTFSLCFVHSPTTILLGFVLIMNEGQRMF